MYGLSAVFEVAAPTPTPTTAVASDWSLIPTGLTTGDQFRLIFLSSTKRDGSSTDIATYNTFIQTRAAAGHTDIQAYSDGFTVVGCTAAVDATDNTGTTGVGVPIYWLNGAKVADDYADFYDGDWADEANDKNELGANGPDTLNSGNYPITGCDHDGTELTDGTVSLALGSSTGVVVAQPHNSGAGPLSGPIDVSRSNTRPMYGLSEVFEVAAAGANIDATGKPAITGTANIGQTLTASKGTIADSNGTTKADNGDSGYAYTYQWVRVSGGAETTISGATGTTYIPVADDVGNTIKVQASFTDDADNAEGPLTSDATAAVVVPCDALWCATMTVGSSGTTVGFSDGTIASSFPAMGSLSPSQFRYDGSTITVHSLVFYGDPGDMTLDLAFTLSILGSSDYTLELNDESFIFSGTGGDGYFDVDTSPTFADGDTVAVKLFEGSGGGTLSDDATLTSLDFYATVGQDAELVTLTPAFDAGTTAYTAVVDYRFITASMSNIVRGEGGASVVVTDEFASYDLDTGSDAEENLELAVGENTITVEVTAADGETTVTYTLVVTRTAPPPPPAHCETGDIWCATLTASSLPGVGVGYSGAQGTLSHVAFEHGPFYLVETLLVTELPGVGTSLRIEFHPSGGTVFNADAYSLFIDGTEFAFSDATFSSGHFEWADTGLLWAPADTVEVRLFERTAPAVRVPTDWSLIPAGLSTGDQFRLIFLSSTTRDGTATDIATYNSFVQTRAAAGHTDIQAYSTWFSVVGCTADSDAIVNTGTTGGGVPIYWLNGDKVADDYADFYDGDWDEEAVNKNELGENGPNTAQIVNYPLTGCAHDGTEAFQSTVSLALGASTVTVGRPDSSDTGHGPIAGSLQNPAENRPMYGLSAVFGVGVQGANSDPTFPMSTAVREVAENTEAGELVGAVLTATDFDMDTLTYTLEGTNLLSFDLDTTTTPGSAQIRTKMDVTYDHEVKSSYSVIVKADDGHGGTPARVTVTIEITDVDEPPDPPDAPMVTEGSSTSLDVSWTAPATTGPDIDDYDLRYREGTSGGWTNGPQDVTGTSAAIGSLDAGTSYQVQVRATNAEGDSDWSPSGSGTTAEPAPAVTVPSDWSLIPAGLTTGDQFRLIFLSQTKRDGSATDIATYNSFIQTRAAAGHADIQAYSDGFTVVGCTEDIDAVDNTGATGVGVPIYWLNGAKVADDYPDFYDEDWDEEAADKNELGNNGRNTNNSSNYPLTGCDHDGTQAFTGATPVALGSATAVRVGRPNSSANGHGPISNPSIGATPTSNRPMYGLSAVFEVAAAANSDPTFPMSTADREVAENTAAGQDVGAVLTATDADMDTLTYTLEGTDQISFDLVTTSGSAQIHTKTGVTYNYEVKSSYTVVVKADDNNGGAPATVTVTIEITDEDEPPERPAAPMVTATAGSTTSLDVSWTEPATTGPDIDDYDLRYRAGTSGTWTNSPQNVTATTTAIGSLDAGTSYQVQVRATNAEGNSRWSPSGSGTTTAEATPTVSISADKTSAVFKEDGITYTLTRSGATTAALPVMVTLTQTKDFLATADLSQTVTIAAGQSTGTFTVAASSFEHFAAGALVEGGTLTAAVQDGADYDLGSPSSVDVSIVIGVTVRFEQASYTIGEAGGTLSVKLIGRTGAGAPQPTSMTGNIVLSSNNGSAINFTDFHFFTTTFAWGTGAFIADGGRWKAEHSLDITITNDALDENSETFNLKVQRHASTLAYSLVDANGNSCGSVCTVTVTITDDDTAGVTISKSSLTVTEQDATGDSYTVVLDTQPTADVVVTVAGYSGTDLTLTPDPATLTFTMTDWATAQTVTATAGNDADTADDTVALTHSAASADTDYQGITIAGVSVTVPDNDTAQVTGVMVEPGNGQLVVEWTAVANATGYQVQWKSGGQSYNTSGRQATIGSGSTTSHTISSLNNGTEYTVRMRATRTGANNGAYSAEVLETPVMPTAAGVTISESSLTLTEQDTTGDTYTVVLDSQPTANVTITIGGQTAADITATPTPLTFTTTNWATPQTVTVTAGNDTDTVTDTHSLTHSAASADTDYQGITIAGVSVTVPDNDTAQVTGVMVEPGNGQLVVEWTAVANATGYELQWKSGGESYNNGDRQATVSSGTTTSHTIGSLNNDTEYTLRIRATRTGANNGAYSAEVLETPVMPTEACDALWCATMTVGSGGGATGFSDGTTGSFFTIGSLSPSQFPFEGATITVNSLAFFGDPGDMALNLEFTGSLGSSDYTLELDDESFILSGTGGSGYFDVDASSTFADGDTVTVKLFEGSGGGTLSDDATLTSLEFYAAVIQDDELVTLTPAFDAGTTEYTASVAYRFAYASIENIVRGDSGAAVVVTDEVGSHDLGTDDSVEGLELAVGENTITVTVTAADGNTTETYTLVVTRAAQPPLPAHCETGDIWCATLTVAALSGDEFGYSGAQGTSSHIYFEHDGTAYIVDALFINSAFAVVTRLRIDFHPPGDTVFNTDDFVLYIDGTAFAFSDATFTSTYFEWANSGLTWALSDTVEVRLVEQSDTVAAPPTEVPLDWSLIPAGLSSGDTFRLIFLSSTKRDGSATDIATYNTFVQTRAAAGHTDIQAYSDGFTVVGCTAAADAVGNTGTTGVGVPIYWLNGNKVADDYADFYDEDWDEEAADKNELGNNGPDTTNSGNYPITGCDDDGTEAFSSIPGSEALGSDGGSVRVGRPNSSTTGHGPLSSTSTTGDTNNRPMYGLSAVFQVGAAPPTEVPSDWSLIPAGLTTGDTFRLIFLSSTKRDGSATDIATYNTFVQTRAAAGHTDIQAYSDGFTVVGCTADTDAVGNTGTFGVGVPIYWLNGAKVADDYADFYDEDWDEEAADKNELGENGPNTNNSGNYPITGCDHDGTGGGIGSGSNGLGTSDGLVSTLRKIQEK